MLIEPSATTAWARALAHHRSIDAAPFSVISSIGIRLEPRVGATSSISVVPKGNASPAAANGGVSKRQNSTSKTRQQHTIIGTPDQRAMTVLPDQIGFVLEFAGRNAIFRR